MLLVLPFYRFTVLPFYRFTVLPPTTLPVQCCQFNVASYSATLAGVLTSLNTPKLPSGNSKGLPSSVAAVS